MTETRLTVLIVDDDPEIVEVLKDHFRQRNCEAIATTDPATVVEKLRNFHVALMLLDLKMRELDGFDVLDKIKKAGLTLPSTLVITGHLPKYQDRLSQHGIRATDVVTKPFTFDTLERAINRMLGAQIVSAEVGSEYEDKIYQKNRCRIAFVEDEEDILDYFSGFFGERHYQVSCYSHGSKAAEALKQNPVDVAVIDMKLPGMQGDRIMEALSQTATPPYLIAISADPFRGPLQERLKSFGCKDFIMKPLDIIELIELVKTVAIERGLLG